jgi:Tfp pilus assembly protein PilO
MRKLVFVLLVVVVIIGVGFYRGWFMVDPKKIEQDEIRAKQEVRELLQEAKEKADQRKKPTKEPQ